MTTTPLPHPHDALTWRPDAAAYAARLLSLEKAATIQGVDAVVLAPGPDTLYYLGRAGSSYERLTALILRPGRRPQLIVPALEQPGWASLPIAPLLEFVTWTDGMDAYALAASALPRAAQLAVDDQLPARHVFGLTTACAPSATVLAGALVGPQRMSKDADELAALAAVGAANDAVHARIAEFLRPGRTEDAVAADIDRALVEAGHARADFVIVGSGPNGASPHHTASDRVLQVGDAVVVDIGGPAPSGYNSDSTRTYCLGAPSDPDFERVHQIVRDAQEAGVRAAVAGATCASVDAASRSVIEDAGYGEFFITRTGHGIGLEVHEQPYLVTGNDTLLAPGMAFSVEPGIYLPGRFGVRIEDIVTIDHDGQPRRLNNSPHGWQLG